MTLPQLTADPDPAVCRRKAELCGSVLASLGVLQPGLSCRRGMVLYEQHTVLLVLASNTLKVRHHNIIITML